MNKTATVLRQLIFLTVSALLLSLTSCHSSRAIYYKGVDMRQVVRAADRLGFDIERKDNLQLMIESASWIGTPYRYGGNTRSGVDCSGFTSAIYRDVYGVQLQRRSIDQYEKDCKAVKKRKLKQGDLLFFATSGKAKKNNINHTGIYLRDGKFIHASSSRGVVVDNLNSDYFKRCWVDGGRVNR